MENQSSNKVRIEGVAGSLSGATGDGEQRGDCQEAFPGRVPLPPGPVSQVKFYMPTSPQDLTTISPVYIGGN